MNLISLHFRDYLMAFQKPLQNEPPVPLGLWFVLGSRIDSISFPQNSHAILLINLLFFHFSNFPLDLFGLDPNSVGILTVILCRLETRLIVVYGLDQLLD